MHDDGQSQPYPRHPLLGHMATWWQWLGPSAAVVVCVVLAWAWRAAMLWVRQAEVATPLERVALAKGLLWDAILLYGLFLVVRAGLRLGRIWRPLGWLVVAPAWLILALVPLARAVDLAHCFLTRAHFTADSFVYLTGGFEQLLATPRALGLALATIAAILLHMAMVKRDAERRAVLEMPNAVAATVALLLAGALMARGLYGAIAFPPHVYALNIVPEANLAQQGAAYLRHGAELLPVPDVPPAQWQVWQKWGWVPQEAQLGSAYPLLRLQSDEPQLTLPERPGVTAKPNVAVVLMESTSSLFIHALSGKYRGLMPQLGDVAREVTVVEGYHNVASPTIAGTIGTLCSVFSPLHPADLADKPGAAGQPAFSCLPDVLRRQGYRTVFIGGADPRQADTDVFLHGHGVDEVHGKADILKRFPGTPESPLGVHDEGVLRYAQEQIERLERLKEEDGRPFLVMVATLDTHEPGLPPAGCALPRDATGGFAVEGVPEDAAGQRQLAAYHCSDKAVAAFARFLLAQPRRDRLLWALTADHAPFRTRANESVFRGHDVGWSFDRLPLLLHNPRHEMPQRVAVLAGTLDVAPTLLHLLGVSDAGTTFTGHSIFGRRRDVPLLIGRVGTRVAWMSDGTASREVPFGGLAEQCARGEAVVKGRADLPDACALQQHFAWLDALWSQRRIRPVVGLEDGH